MIASSSWSFSRAGAPSKQSCEGLSLLGAGGGDLPRGRRGRGGGGGEGRGGRSCAGLPRPASIRTLDRTPKSAKKIERSKPGEAFTSLFAGGSSKKATLLRFFVFFRFVFRGAPVPRSLSRLREGRGEGAEMCSLEKVGRFLENREKEERREGKSRWHSFSTRHRFSFAPLDLDLNLDLRPRRRKGKLTLSISPPLFFYNPRLLFLPPSFPHPQLLIKGIRSFSPDNEVKMGSFWVLFLSLSSLPFSGSFRSLPTTNSNQKNISKKKKKTPNRTSSLSTSPSR